MKVSQETLYQVVKEIKNKGEAKEKELVNEPKGLYQEKVNRALKEARKQGLVSYDPETRIYKPRENTEESLFAHELIEFLSDKNTKTVLAKQIPIVNDKPSPQSFGASYFLLKHDFPDQICNDESLWEKASELSTSFYNKIQDYYLNNEAARKDAERIFEKLIKRKENRELISKYGPADKEKTINAIIWRRMIDHNAFVVIPILGFGAYESELKFQDLLTDLNALEEEKFQY